MLELPPAYPLVNSITKIAIARKNCTGGTKEIHIHKYDKKKNKLANYEKIIHTKFQVNPSTRLSCIFMYRWTNRPTRTQRTDKPTHRPTKVMTKTTFCMVHHHLIRK